jgi:serine-type D-Ala-D-Ala carboxypeptidase (penicillin-binding protein 5/6)
VLRKLAIQGVATFLLILTAAPAAAADFTPQAKAAVLMDGATGQILYQLNGTDTNYPASTTKVLTALVAVEHAKDPNNLSDRVKISADAVHVPPDSSMCYLQEGEEHDLRTLLMGLMLVSGNDCANAIAEGVTGGDRALFIRWMNETAVRLGATSSHFTNTHGYHEENHYTTAHDLALIAKAAFQNAKVREVTSTRDFFWYGKSERNGTYFNQNKVLYTYEGTVGGKTGFTEEAGPSLVNAAERNGRLLVGVILGAVDSNQRNVDMESMLDLGFSEFTTQTVFRAGAPFGDVPVKTGLARMVPAVAAEGFSASAPISGSAKVIADAKLTDQVTAPVTAGQELGVVEIKENGQLLGTVPLVAEVNVEAQPQVAERVLSGVVPVLKWLAYAAVALLAVRVTVKTVRRVLRKSRRRNQSSPRPASSQNRGTIDFYRTRSR